ncbi:MAG: malto-oligosyltrehalose trehalohydrolase [Acidimicrobiales bacterium]
MGDTHDSSGGRPHIYVPLDVWAPAAERVELALNDERVPMSAVGGGWWRADVEAVATGDRYGFAVDVGPVRPDSRSPSQPDGIDGLSEVVDHGAFVWTDATWRGMPLAGAVLYELHVGTFTEAWTFDGAIERLDHLVSLGVDAVEVMPIAEFSGSHGWGYDGVDLFAPHHAYGGPDGFKRFVDACHAVGLGVVLDVVYNHLGPAGNYLAEFGPYFSETHHTNWGGAVNFDGPHSDEVRRFVLDNVAMWFRDYHVDGLRLDAVHAIVDDSALHLLEQMSAKVAALAAHLRRTLLLIAETDLNDTRFVVSRDAGGMGLDGAWADDWHHALHAALTGERSGYYEDFGSLDQLATALRQGWVYDGAWSEHRRRVHGRSPDGISRERFVVCTQNHDQVGNRAVGERLTALTSPGRARVAAALLLTGPFTPLLFQGEEWGASSPFQYFTDHADPELGTAVSEGRPREFERFGWDPESIPDPQDPQTFRRSILVWSELDEPDHRRMLEWYRALLDLRRRLPDLADPTPESVEVSVDHEAEALVVARGRTRVLVNLGPQPFGVPLLPGESVLLCSEDSPASDGTQVDVPPDSVVVVSGARRVAAAGATGPAARPFPPR